jgi:hypothetical protein
VVAAGSSIFGLDDNPVYSCIYDCMVAFYVSRKIASTHVHQYAITTLSVLGFLNFMAAILWAQKAFDQLRKPPVEVLVFVGLFIALQLYSRWLRQRRRVSGEQPSRPSWIGGAYIIASFAMVIYAARWAPM